MIDPTRLAELDAILTRVTQTVPAKIKALFRAFDAQGLGGTFGQKLTLEVIKGIFAVPSQAELPQPPQQ